MLRLLCQMNKMWREDVNPLVPGMQNVKIRQFIVSCLLIICLVKRLVCLDAHYIKAYSEKSNFSSLDEKS